jgi:general L-amino acid transport system permease protein
MAIAEDTMRPPVTETGMVGWARQNLFSTPTNTILTLIGAWIAYKAITGVLSWAVFNATWEGLDGSACTWEGAGACWPFITAKFSQFMYGRYPVPDRWRVDLTYVLAIAGLVPLMIPSVPGKLWNAIYAIFIFPVLAFILLLGGVFGLPHVPTDLWGGLLITLVVASSGIAGAFPLGILLALGRRSKMPIVRWVSVGYI